MLILHLSYRAFAQEDHNYNEQVWLDFNPKIVLKNNKVLFYGNLGYRTIFPSDWHRYYLNPGLSYSPFIHNNNRSPAIQYRQLHAGLGDYFTKSFESVILNEIRTYLGVS